MDRHCAQCLQAVDACVDGRDTLNLLVVEGVLNDCSSQIRADLLSAYVVAGSCLNDTQGTRGANGLRTRNATTTSSLLKILGD